MIFDDFEPATTAAPGFADALVALAPAAGAGGEYPGSISMLVDEQRTFIDNNIHFAIVIHKTAANMPAGQHTTAEDQARFFATNSGKKSVHFVVGKDGHVVQCVLLKDGAGGNCCVEPGFNKLWAPYVNPDGSMRQNLNTLTISIEHCDDSVDNSDAVTPAQKAASFDLIKWLCNKYDIPAERVMTHASIAPVTRARCPGNYPMDELLAFVRGNVNPTPVPTPVPDPVPNHPGVPAGWSDDGKTLTAPNGKVVVLGFRDWVLVHSWKADNLPEENETGGHQRFRDTVLEFSPEKGVYDAGKQVSDELTAIIADRDNLATLLAAANAQINDLKAGLPLADIKNASEACSRLAADLNKFSV
jgi:hypothetical protein